LSLRRIEEMFLERGIAVSREGDEVQFKHRTSRLEPRSYILR
jgi:hypothetical protein